MLVRTTSIYAYVYTYAHLLTYLESININTNILREAFVCFFLQINHFHAKFLITFRYFHHKLSYVLTLSVVVINMQNILWVCMF